MVLGLIAVMAGTAGGDERKLTFGLEVFVVVENGSRVKDRAWLDAEVAHANELFAAAGIDFEIARIREIDARWAHIATRDHRDALGRRARTPGLISVFLVRQLDDVDIEGKKLFGVHWRYRKDRKKTWVILSARDKTATALAHELGHFFGLPHSRYRKSVMNKRPRAEPSWPERVFVKPELSRIRRECQRFLRAARLTPR